MTINCANRHQPLEEQIDDLKRRLTEVQSENERSKQRLEKLGVLVLEREKKIAELKHYEYRFRKISEQNAASEHGEAKYHDQLSMLLSDKERLSKQLEDSQQHAAQLERVIRFLRERQEEVKLEANQFQEEFHKAQHGMVEYVEKAQAADRTQQELVEIIQQERLAKEEALEEVQALHMQFESLKKMLADAKSQSDKWHAEKCEAEAVVIQLKDSIDKRNREFDDLLMEKETLLAQYQQESEEAELYNQQILIEKQEKQEELDQALAAQYEAESRLKMAQQHLAKKVKETSDLHDKVHSQEVSIQELQSNLEQARIRFAEQQLLAEAQLQQEKRLQEQLLESAKSNESLANTWEKQYFNIHEKWQDNELRIKELKKIEEKHSQLQALLANIGGFFNTPVNYSNTQADHLPRFSAEQEPANAPQPKSMKPEPISNESLYEGMQIIERSDMKKPYQNLFDISAPNKHSNNNFFE